MNGKDKLGDSLAPIACFGAALLLCASSAVAAQPAARAALPTEAMESAARARVGAIAVLKVSGSGGERLRRHLVELLEGSGRSVASSAAVARSGPRASGGAASFEAARRALEVESFLDLSLKWSRGKPAAVLRVLGGDGGVLAEESLEAASLNELSDQLGEKLEPLLLRAFPPPPPPPAPKPEPVVEAPTRPRVRPWVGSAPAAPQEELRPGFELALSGGVLRRQLRFTDDLLGSLRTLDVPAAPILQLSASANLGSRSWPSRFAVRGNYSQLTATSSPSPGGQALPIQAYAGEAGLRYGQPLGEQTIGLFAGYGAQSLEIQRDAGGVDGLTPDVRYRYLRTGLDLVFRFGPLALWLEGAHRQLVGGSPYGEWFPNSTGRGIDAAAGLGVRPERHVELRVSATYQRYFSDLSVAPADPVLAGGAVDEFATGWVSVAFLLSAPATAPTAPPLAAKGQRRLARR